MARKRKFLTYRRRKASKDQGTVYLSSSSNSPLSDNNNIKSQVGGNPRAASPPARNYRGLQSGKLIRVNKDCQSKRGIRKKHCGDDGSRMMDSSSFESYVEKIWMNLSEEKKDDFMCIDCLWFSLYLDGSWKENVLSWVRGKSIFSKKYVFVPIIRWSHWSLLILCDFGKSLMTQGPCMLLLDSLKISDPEQRLEISIRKFILDIYRAEGCAENEDLICRIPLLIPNVPQQRNQIECGNFVLYYIHLFIEEAPYTFSISDGYPYFMSKNWFTPESLQKFFQELHSPETPTRRLYTRRRRHGV